LQQQFTFCIKQKNGKRPVQSALAIVSLRLRREAGFIVIGIDEDQVL
jgi:hypothetical protein